MCVGTVSPTVLGTILVIEDDPNILDILLEGLVDEGYRPVGATGPEEAVSLLTAASFDLILTDAFRPAGLVESEGRWGTLAGVCAAAGTTPIVIVTAHQLDEYADFRARGFAALLAKPFDLHELYEVVRRTLAVDGGQ